MIFIKDKKQRPKPELCEICNKKPAVTTMRGFAGVGIVWVCKDCKKNVRI